MQSSDKNRTARTSDQARSQACYLQDAHKQLDGDQGRVAALHQRFKEEVSALSAEIQQLSGSIALSKHGVAGGSIAHSRQLDNASASPPDSLQHTADLAAREGCTAINWQVRVRLLSSDQEAVMLVDCAPYIRFARIQSALWRRFSRLAPPECTLLPDPEPLPITRLLTFMVATARAYGFAVIDGGNSCCFAQFVHQELLRCASLLSMFQFTICHSCSVPWSCRWSHTSHCHLLL